MPEHTHTTHRSSHQTQDGFIAHSRDHSSSASSSVSESSESSSLSQRTTFHVRIQIRVRSGFGFHGTMEFSMVDAASRTIKAKKQPRSLCLEGRYGSLRRRVPGCVSACESETLCILVYLFTVFVYNHQSPISTCREVSANTFIFTVLW